MISEKLKSANSNSAQSLRKRYLNIECSLCENRGESGYLKHMLQRLFLLIFLVGWRAEGQIPSDAASLAAGKKLYEFHCAFCHGKGDDGMAANLMSANLPHAPSDTALFNILKNGIPGTDMPAALGLSDAEAWQVAAFVRGLGRAAPQAVAGEKSKGAVSFKTRCASCHMVNGVGGRMGPDLSDVGAKRSPMNLRTSILDSDAAVVAGWGVATIEMLGGKKISGVLLNEDQFQMVLRDSKGKMIVIDKTDTVKIKEIERSLRSGMPSYRGRIADPELDDLVAYLFSLRGGN